MSAKGKADTLREILSDIDVPEKCAFCKRLGECVEVIAVKCFKCKLLNACTMNPEDRKDCEGPFNK